MILGQDDPFTTIDAITLVIAALGAMTGVASLALTVSQYFMSGPRLRVEITAARLGPTSQLVGGTSWDNADAETLAGHPVPAVAVQVVNKGRMPTIIDSWGVDVGRGTTYRQLDLSQNPELPAKIEAGQRLTFVAELIQVVAANHAAQALGVTPGQVHGIATRGDGRTIRSTTPLAIPTE